MTRKEKIYFEIDKRKYRADCPFDYEDGFKRGVEWADKNPKNGMVSLEKACEMLYAMLTVQDIYDYDYVTAPAYDTVVDFVEDFRKAMEE